MLHVSLYFFKAVQMIVLRVAGANCFLMSILIPQNSIPQDTAFLPDRWSLPDGHVKHSNGPFPTSWLTFSHCQTCTKSPKWADVPSNANQTKPNNTELIEFWSWPSRRDFSAEFFSCSRASCISCSRWALSSKACWRNFSCISWSLWRLSISSFWAAFVSSSRLSSSNIFLRTRFQIFQNFQFSFS